MFVNKTRVTLRHLAHQGLPDGWLGRAAEPALLRTFRAVGQKSATFPASNQRSGSGPSERAVLSGASARDGQSRFARESKHSLPSGLYASTNARVSARLLSLGCLFLLGCSSAPTPVRVSPGLPAANSSAAGEALGSTLRAYSLGKVEPGTYGPVSVSLEAGTLSVWASPRGNERVWHARAVERDGHVASAPVVIGTTGLGLGLVSLSPVTQGLRGLLVY